MKRVRFDCVKHRFADDMEISLVFGIENKDGGLYFEDITSVAGVDEHEEEMRTIQHITGAMKNHYRAHREYPNQSTLINQLRGLVSKDAVRDELVSKCNILWTEQRRGRNETYYVPIEEGISG